MKVLIAGLGSIGQRHARNLRALLGGQVDILAHRVRGLAHVIAEDMTIEAGADVEDRYGIRAFDRLEAALAEGPVATLVCNPTSLHVPTAVAALRAGSHVLIEKPLSGSCDGVSELLDLVAGGKPVAAVAYQMRFHPALLGLRDLLGRQAIGAIQAVRAEWHDYLPDAHPYEDYRQSYAARADLGGGVILSYSHEFDYLFWLFGMPQRLSTTGGRLGRLEIDVEDTAVTRMECQVDGRPLAIELRQGFGRPARTRTCEVVGEAGTIFVDLNAPELVVTDRDGKTVQRQAFSGCERNQLFMDELKHFLSAMAGHHPPAVSVRDAAQSLRIALAARESLATGGTVELH